MNTFESLNLDEQLLQAINRLGFKHPTQIQNESIPLILEGYDVIGESATGSGKTLAFGAGIIKICEPGQGLQALVLVPTRELAEQVKEDIVKLTYKKAIRVLAVYGGVSINPQIDRLNSSEVVIATPGRLLDHMSRRTVDTSKVKLLVLDEADRMVEMGFIDDVERIINACPKNRQTLLFSATMYGPATQIAKRYMKDAVTVNATRMVDPSKLKQTYFDVSSKQKKEILVYLLQQEKSELVMVFCNTRRGTDMVVKVLKANGIKAASIHGGQNQNKRMKTIDMFHEGKFHVLVCTDVAARGLHIEGVTHIYNFDIPNEPGDYVHRIGRTARAGNDGLVFNILTYRDYDNFSRVQGTYRDEFEILRDERPIPKITIKHVAEGDSRRSRHSGPRRGSPRRGDHSSGSSFSKGGNPRFRRNSSNNRR